MSYRQSIILLIQMTFQDYIRFIDKLKLGTRIRDNNAKNKPIIRFLFKYFHM